MILGLRYRVTYRLLRGVSVSCEDQKKGTWCGIKTIEEDTINFDISLVCERLNALLLVNFECMNMCDVHCN